MNGQKRESKAVNKEMVRKVDNKEICIKKEKIVKTGTQGE